MNLCIWVFSYFCDCGFGKISALKVNLMDQKSYLNLILNLLVWELKEIFKFVFF